MPKESNASKINLSFYTGHDQYSDGDIENDILEIVKREKDYTQVLAQDNRWPVLYHLSPIRRNLLEWYSFKENSAILEIGAGCGALTGLLCERLQKVTAIELSKRRAEIIAQRNEEKTNLEIIVGNISDVKTEEKFDYVTLIGVLEYAGMFIKTSTPVIDLLSLARSFLKPAGTIIIAIENKFGLKYWAGAREDHTGNFFEGLEGYPERNDVATYSKQELSDVLSSAGCKDIKFYYPLPDYKLPTHIYSDDYLPLNGHIRISPNYDRDRLTLFNERFVSDNIIKSKQFDFFANSFLIFAEFRS